MYLFLLIMIQGIGECLPISSSAHLYFLTRIFGYPPTSLEVEVALHLGSLIAIVLFLFQKLQSLLIESVQAIVTFQMTKGAKTTLGLICATLPAVFAGFIVKRYFPMEQTLFAIGVVSVIFGLLLILSDKTKNNSGQDLHSKDIGEDTHFKNSGNDLQLKDAWMIGLAQIFAFIPGASRLGVCLTAARFLKITRWQASEYAFLLAIPTILGAVVLTGFDIVKEDRLDTLLPLIPAIAFTSILSLFVLKGFKFYVTRYSFKPFGVYRIILGVFLVLLAYIKL